MEISPLIWESSGIPNYIRRLLGGIAAVDTENRYFLYTNREIPADLRLPENFSIEILDRPSPRFQLWFQMQLPLRLRKDRVDIFHGLFYRLPLFMGVPGVITVHDLSGYLMPEVHHVKTHVLNLLYPIFVARAARIIAVSRFTANELRDNFPNSPEKTTVIHEAPPDEYAPVEDPALLSEAAEKYRLPEKFILFLGTLEPRKNLTRLIEAYSSICHSIPHELVLAGAMGWKNRSLNDLLETNSLKDRIHLTGYVDSEDIPALFSLAEFSVYPSLYEGFGLPVLESMACGTPVLTSSVSSLPEVSGGAALLADPLSTESIAEGLRNLALSDDLREDLRRKGFARAAEFSWEKAARETIEVYRSVLDEEAS